MSILWRRKEEVMNRLSLCFFSDHVYIENNKPSQPYYLCCIVDFSVVSTKPFPITRRQILDPSKLKEFADDNFRYDENGRKFSKWVENTVGKEKLLVTSNFSFSHSVYLRLVSQGRQKV